MTNPVVLVLPVATGVALPLHWRRKWISALRKAGGAVPVSTVERAAEIALERQRSITLIAQVEAARS